MYNQAELNLSIDTLVLKLEIKPCSSTTMHSNLKLLKKVFTDNGMELDKTYISEQNHYVVYNQFGSGITSINYELMLR